MRCAKKQATLQQNCQSIARWAVVGKNPPNAPATLLRQLSVRPSVAYDFWITTKWFPSPLRTSNMTPDFTDSCFSAASKSFTFLTGV